MNTKNALRGILFLILFVISGRLEAQNPTITKLKIIGDSVESYRVRKYREIYEDSLAERYFSKGGYDRFFDKYFTQIKYERESFTEGNSAALKVADNKTTLNLTLSHKSHNTIFGIGTALNISDNSGVLFSGNQPTAGTEIFGSFSFLFPKSRFLFFQGPFQEFNYVKRRALVDSLWEIHSMRNPSYGYLLMNKIRLLDYLFIRYDSIIRYTKDSSLLNYKDSLVSVINQQVKAKQELQSLVNGFTTALAAYNEIISTANETGVKNELATNGVTSFRMFWVTTGISYRRDDYATYDSIVTFSDRINDRTFDRVLLNTAFNFFWQRTDSWIGFLNSKTINSFYANVNYSLVRTNTFEDLDEINFSVIKTKTENDTSYQFASSKKLRDITGKSYSTGWLHRLGFAATAMIGKKQFFGINMFASTDLRNNYEPVFNSHLGALFRFKDSEDEKSVVNFEFFFAFNDMSDSKGKGKSTWQNTQIGISANVPFKKVFFR